MNHRPPSNALGLSTAGALSAKNSAPALLILLAFLVPGCSKKDLEEAYENAKSQAEEVASSTKDLAESSKQAVSSAVKAVEAKLPSKGSMTLQTDLAIPNPERASIELIVIGDGRPNVVQICSYDPSSEQLIYPAVLIHGPTDRASIGELSGTSIQCDMYVQANPSSTIGMTPAGGHVNVMFGAINTEDQTLSATIENGVLAGSDQKTYEIRNAAIVAAVTSEGT